MSIPDIKQFSGVMNTDDGNDIMPLTHVKMLRNGRFRGNGNNYRVENIPGNTLITNNLPTGVNQCIGAFYDDLRQRIFWFNYNSTGLHGIYQLTISTRVVTTVVIVGAGTVGDIFAFDLDNPIYAVKMLYGDDTQGDTLFFNNCQRQPCEINIKTALAGGYGTIKRSFIDVIKAPAILPPYAVYGNDNAVTVNNLRKKLFQFFVIFTYKSKNKSVTSARSIEPIPVDYLDVAIDKDPTKNCVINLVVPTGETDVDTIEVCAVQSGKVESDGVTLPNQFSDPFVIATLDKSALSISSNDLYKLQFYNNQAYLPVDPDRAIELFDYVPLKAIALEMLNGNVPIYAAITEGFNKTVVSGTATSSSEPAQTTQPPFIFASTQSGDSGFGTGNIHTVLIGKVVIGNTYNIYTTNQTITFVATVATTANVITGLSAAAVIAGFTVVSSDTENLTIIKTGESLQRTLAVPLTIAVTDSFVYDRNSRYNYVIIYFDAAGRTIGSQTSNGMNFQTINYTETTGVENIPKIQFSISSRPPLDARYYSIGRTKNLSKLRKLEWVSDRTYKDADYAYISIENLNTFILNNPSAKHLAYDFASNDRIRFYKVLSGSVNTIYTNNDFEILSQVIAPIINGTQYTGQFLKILLPTTSGTFDFGSSAFFNYFIELYTPAQSVLNGLDQDYEFGERYTIGNYGTSTAFHQGMLQNQTSNLGTPATFEFTQGDYYYRNRTINVGAEYNYIVEANEEGIGRTTLAVTYVSETYADANITPGSSPSASLAGFNPATDLTRYLLKVDAVTNALTFRIKGNITVTFSDFAEIFTFFLIDSNLVQTYLVPPQTFIQGSNTIPIDVTFQMQPNSRVFIEAYSIGGFANSKTYYQTDLKITRQLPFTVGVVDPNFSDYFESKVNSNSRAFIVDINAAQVFNPTLLRWGLAYQPNTNINQVNRFKGLNFDEIDRGKGQIQILKVRDRTLRAFQERGVGQLGIYAKFLQDSGNTNILTTTDEIITKNNVQYYEGVHGVGNQPTGVVSGKNQDYFIDPVTGYQLRLSNNGFTVISELYKGQFFIQPLFIPYNFNYVRPDASKAKILGCYDYAEENYMTILQGGTLGSKSIDNYAFSFNEKRNAYCSFYDILNPDWIISANDVIYSWKNGQLYAHDNINSYTEFYGVQYNTSATLVFNDKAAIKKTYMALSYQSNGLWTAPESGDIITSMVNPQTNLQQISMLKDFDFKQQEGIFYAAFKRDLNSKIINLSAWYNGDFLKGSWIEISLTYFGNEPTYLYLPYIKYSLSGRNL